MAHNILSDVQVIQTLGLKLMALTDVMIDIIISCCSLHLMFSQELQP